MNKELIGIWSGILWRTLNERGKLSVQALKQATWLETESIYAAIGWLAREGNICFDDNNRVSLYIYHEHYY